MYFSNYLFIEFFHWGIMLTSSRGTKRYIGYTERQAEKLYREEFNLKGKHLVKRYS